MLKIKFILIAFNLFLFFNIFSQKGKDGAKTVSTANAKVNAFTALTSNASIGSTTISVASSSLNTNFTSTLTPGDLVMIIQMQGALMNLGTYAIPWQPDSTYGKIYDYANCGNYEFAEVKSVISGTQIELNCGLKYAYNSSGKTQIVRVPRYNSLTIAGTGTLTTDAWNGTIGGILSIEVDGNTTINSGGLISANALGFRGGVPLGNGGSGNGNYVTRNVNDGAEKGEGIGSARLTNTIVGVDSLGKQCKGAPANGGGGGNANNCGGGGGANGGNINGWNGYGIPGAGFNAIWDLEWPGRASVTSSGGGKGGYGTSTTTTANINSAGPNNAAWGSFKRASYGGFGGRPLDYSTGKLFMGGGGGAGHMSSSQSNGAEACAGGSGGGIIYILNYGTISGTGTITANGANGANAFGTGVSVQGIDGAGGAGAGGTIILQSNGTISSIIADANGGNGGNQTINFPVSTSEGQGPGGGGGGGYIAGNGSVFTQNVNGGANGTTNARAFATDFPMNGATSGDIGTSNQVIAPSFSLSASINQTICTNQSTTVTATSTNTNSTIEWYNSLSGNSIATGTVYTTPTYTATGTYTIYVGSCPGVYRLPIIITVNTGAAIIVNSPTICPNQTVTLTASGATTYTWSTGPANTNTVSVSPASTTIYTVNTTSGLCIDTKTTQVTVSSVPTISVPNATICTGTSTVLTASGTATSFTWMPGSITTSTISANSNTNYTITGSNGTCTNSITATVTVVPTPTLTASSQTICPGQVATFTVSGANTYTWNPGGVTGNTFTITPASSTTVSVIGDNGVCTTQKTLSVTVSPNPTVSVNNQIICPTQTITLTANGATTYSWSTGALSNTISVSPASTTIYTVTGITSFCSDTKTVEVTVASQPTLAITGNTAICSGNSTTLTANGTATSYTWMPGSIISPTISANSNANYIVTGSDGVCSNTATSTVSVTPTPTITGVSNTTICPTQTATFTAGGATSFTWQPGNFVGATYTIAPSSNATISVIGANGTCTTFTTVSITIGSNVSITVPGITICPNQSATLTANSLDTYTWSTTANTNSIVVTPTSTTVYTVTGSVGTCTGITTVTVSIIDQPTLAITGNTNICSGGSTTLTANGTATSYTWQAGGQPTQTISVNPNTTTNYTITGGNGVCTNSIISTVSVTSTPTITGVSDISICTGQTASFTAGGATTFTWQPNNFVGTTYTIAPSSNATISVIGANGTCTASATASITIGSGALITVNNETICAGQTATLSASGITTFTWSTISNLNPIAVSPTTTTTYTISGNNGSCSGTQTATVTVNAVPVLTVTPNDICSGQTATLNVSGADTYTWNPGNLSGTTQTVNPTSTTIYTVVGTDGNGCINTSITTTTVNVNATPTISINSPSICIGQTATLTASGATSFTWNTTETTATINPSPVLTTTYSGSGFNGTCSSSFTTTVAVDNTTLITNSIAVATCPSQTVALFGTGTNTATTTYTWSNGINSYSQTVAPINTTTYVVNGNSLSGCPALSGTVIVNVNSIAANFSGLDANIMTVGETLNLTDISTGAASIEWDYCDGVSADNQITIPLSDVGTCCIKLVATNTNCKDSITKCINIVNEAAIIIPNVFTPNGDTKNDLFKIHSVGVKSLNCTIYDRWGLKLYEWDGINGFWDGSAKSGSASAGTYFYIINYSDEKDKSITEKGFLTLFKD